MDAVAFPLTIEGFYTRVQLRRASFCSTQLLVFGEQLLENSRVHDKMHACCAESRFLRIQISDTFEVSSLPHYAKVDMHAGRSYSSVRSVECPGGRTESDSLSEKEAPGRQHCSQHGRCVAVVCRRPRARVTRRCSVGRVGVNCAYPDVVD